MRIRAGSSFDVGRQWGIMCLVVRRVVADDVDDGRVGPSGVVQIGKAVGQPGPEVHQRRCRPFKHAPISVRGASHDSFGEAEHTAHSINLVQRGDKVHLRRSRVREADIDATVNEGTDQTVCAIHFGITLKFRELLLPVEGPVQKPLIEPGCSLVAECCVDNGLRKCAPLDARNVRRNRGRTRWCVGRRSGMGRDHDSRVRPVFVV